MAHLWIVDNGTDLVYQYDNAAGRTSGSQSASSTFALAAGNTNPQDVADPPVTGAAASARHARRGRHLPAQLGSQPNVTDWRSAIDLLFAEMATNKRRRS